jgi:hypothetical protein
VRKKCSGAASETGQVQNTNTNLLKQSVLFLGKQVDRKDERKGKT